jgi:hypothetical protein
MFRTFRVLALLAPVLAAQTAPPSLTLDQKEEFLRTAALQHHEGAKKGVTSTVKAMLSDGSVTHAASIQCIEEEKPKFETSHGIELNFRDSYKFNIAAYRLARLLGLESMVPPSIDRVFSGHKGAWTWWIEDVQMDERERISKHLDAPDKDVWARQYQIMKVFDQLIANTDRNQTNILYDKDWKLWMIDHSRAFRVSHQILDPKSLERCDRELLERMKKLNEAQLKAELGHWLQPAEIRGLISRRDLIVKHFEQGAPSAFYDYLTAKIEAPVAKAQTQTAAP